MVYRSLVKTVLEAEIDLATKFQMVFTGHTIFSMEWRIEYQFMLVLMLRHDSLPSSYWTSGRSMFHILALGLLPSVIQIFPSGHVSTRDLLECISAHTDDVARMYGLAVAGDVRNPAVVLVLHASDLVDIFPKADTLVALLSLSFQCPERSSILKQRLPPVLVVLRNARNGLNSQEFVTALAAFVKLEQYVYKSDFVYDTEIETSKDNTKVHRVACE